MTALPVLGRTRRTLNRTYCHISRPFQSATCSLRQVGGAGVNRVSFPKIIDLFVRWVFFVLTYSLAQWAALADGDLVTLLDTESWGNVRSEVLVALLVTGVFWDEVEVLAADDEGSVHLGGDDSSGEDTATDGDKTGEWALLVCETRNVSSCSVRASLK